jgi:hypothetical protein
MTPLQQALLDSPILRAWWNPRQMQRLSGMRPRHLASGVAYYRGPAIGRYLSEPRITEARRAADELEAILQQHAPEACRAEGIGKACPGLPWAAQRL